MPSETPGVEGGRGAIPAAFVSAEAAGRTVLLEDEVYGLLSEFGVAVPAHRVVADSQDVDDGLCAALGSEEAVVKVSSPDLLHKSDVGGVAVCSNDPESVCRAVDRVWSAAQDASPSAQSARVLVAERVGFRTGLGREVLLALRHDPAFGPILVFGVGGLDTEALLGSLRPEQGRAMWAASGLTDGALLEGLRRTLSHAALLRRLRSSRNADDIPEDRLVETLRALARLAERWAGFDPPGGTGLAELEVNPLVAAEDGQLVALDGLARLHRPARLGPPRPIAALRHLLEPRSAVVIGASAGGTNPGRIILQNLVAGEGVPQEKIWAIHPRAEAIEGCRAFPSLGDLPEPADMAVVSVAADRGAERAVSELVESRRARSVILIAGGFAETEGGRAAEARIRAALAAGHEADDGGVLLNGGNCLGILSIPGGYNTFFIPPHKLPVGEAPAHGLASISQSGAYLVSQVSNLEGVIRPRYAISFGNQMDVTVSDYLRYLEGDSETRVVAVYLEGFQPGDGADFLDATARIAASGRTVLLYKAGRTREGSEAAASHTAATVGDHEVTAELVRRAGAVLAESLDQFEDDVRTFTLLEGRRGEGRRVAVLSNAGFECTAAADALHGMTLATLTPETTARVGELLPAGVVDVHNPVDATPITPTDRYAALAQCLASDPGVDAAVVAGVPATPFQNSLGAGEGHGEDVEGPEGLATALTAFFESTPKPVVFSLDSGPLYDPLARAMGRAGLPTFRRIDRATRALARFLGLAR